MVPATPVLRTLGAAASTAWRPKSTLVGESAASGRSTSARLAAAAAAGAAATALGLSAFDAARMEESSPAAAPAPVAAPAPAAANAVSVPLPPVTDGLPYWEARWRTNQTQWHRPIVNPHLRAFLHRLRPADAAGTPRVLVPLCGKTTDLQFLRDEGFEVVGAEGVEKAAREFFDEHALGYAVHRAGAPGFDVVRSSAAGKASISIFVGDFFRFGEAGAGRFDAAWDRGSFVAIDPATREAYVAQMRDAMKPGGRILLEAFFTEKPGYSGPPFVSTPEEVRSLFGRWFWVEEVARVQAWRERNVQGFENIIYILVRKEAKDEL